MIGERIRQARLASGLTQQEVVDRLSRAGSSLTKAGLSKYERGGSTPAADLLLKLAKALVVRAEYFLEEPSAHVHWMAFRSHRSISKTARERIQASATDVVEGQFWLQEKLFPDAGCGFPSPTKAALAKEAESLAADLRSNWELGNGPIESLTGTLEDHGGIVVECTEEGSEFDGLCGRVNEWCPVVVVNERMPDDRRRLSMGHELGHLLMDCGALLPKEEEALAYRFAAAFLVPADVARRELGAKRRKLDLEELKLLKAKHGMSMGAWLRRAFDLQIIGHGQYQSLCRFFRSRGWHKEEPVSYQGKEKPTRLEQMARRAMAEGVITPEMAERLLPGCARQADEVQERKAPVHMSALELMKLPKKDRDRVLMQAATMAQKDYSTNRELTDFEAFGEEDVLDEPA